ncbi:hypothetical protein OF83DRAFT_1179963 [Amylostereum chailletii]|nr:hypothetical protein OF83DRAFT_1179963 [Amylostereum chailletii]
MSYRGWAHVLCEECYYCVEKTTSRILFEFRKRVCRACSKTKLVHWDYLKVPEPFSRRVRKLFTVEDVVPTIRISGVLMCEKAAADEFVKELLGKIKKIGPHDAARLRSATGDLVQARESVLSHRREHIEMCNKWQDKLIEERDRPVINERKECIMWNILALGYTMKDWHDSRLSTHMLVNVGQPLTDKSWSKIRPVLEKKILAIRELYLKRKKSVQGHLLRLYAQAISPAEFPFIPDGETCLKTISLFDRILSNWKYGSSDAAWWTEAQEELLQFVQYMASVGQHNRRCLAKALLRSAPNEVSASNDDLVTLGLALSMFQIRQSDGSLSPTIHFGTEVQCHIAPVSYNVDPKVQRHLKHVVISIHNDGEGAGSDADRAFRMPLVPP